MPGDHQLNLLLCSHSFGKIPVYLIARSEVCLVFSCYCKFADYETPDTLPTL